MLFRLLQRFLAPTDEGVDAGALAAMNTAIAGDTPPNDADVKPEGEGGGDGGAGTGEETPGSQAGAGADGGAAGGEGAAAGADEPETEEEVAAAKAEGRERDPATGRFKPKKAADPAADAAAAAAAAAAGKGKPPVAEIDPATGKPKVAAAAAKKVDHVNDPIPDDVKGKTRTRMEGLVTVAKDLNTKLEAATTELKDARELVDLIDSTGASSETFARHMQVLALMHSPRVEDKEQVIKYLRKAAELVGAQIGETPPGKNPLEGHQDLIDEAETGTLTAARAAEIATHRNKTAAAERLNAENTERDSAATRAAEAEKQTTKALNDLTGELVKKDGEATYKRKHALLVPFIRRMRRDIPSDKIVAAVREAYNELKLGPAAADTTSRVGDQGGKGQPAGTGAQQPLRARQGAAGGGVVREPGSALEAMSNALSELGGGA